MLPFLKRKIGSVEHFLGMIVYIAWNLTTNAKFHQMFLRPWLMPLGFAFATFWHSYFIETLEIPLNNVNNGKFEVLSAIVMVYVHNISIFQFWLFQSSYLSNPYVTIAIWNCHLRYSFPMFWKFNHFQFFVSIGFFLVLGDTDGKECEWIRKFGIICSEIPQIF